MDIGAPDVKVHEQDTFSLSGKHKGQVAGHNRFTHTALS
jgi:hypothetical protein